MTHPSEIPDIFKNTSFGEETIADHLAKQAEDVIQQLTQTYLDATQMSINELNRALTDARTLKNADRAELIKNRLFPIAHDLKGQGTTFGYSLITTLGAHICDKIRLKESFSEDDLDTFQQDTDDMQKVLKEAPTQESSTLQRGILNRLKKG